MSAPKLWLIAGPNGAGKTTLVKAGAVPPQVHTLNPDALTLELLQQRGFKCFAETPAEVLMKTNIAAAEMTFLDLERKLARNEAVCVETVLSTDKYKPLVELVLGHGGVFTLIYVALRSPALSQQRVAGRVKLGGHDVPAAKLEQRWQRSVALLPWFASRATHFWVFDNSESVENQPPVLLANGGRGLLAMFRAEVNPVVAQSLEGSPLFTHKLRMV